MRAYKPKFQRTFYGSICLLLIFFSGEATALAQSLSPEDANSLYGNTVWYKPGGGSPIQTCSTSSSASTTSGGGSNLDYAGNPILTQGELQAMAQNEQTYQQAAQQVGIPWQVLAGIHYRETDLSLNAPANGDGQYQIVKNSYPSSGTISQAEFLQESIDAANFIKSDGGGLNNQPDTATIKNAFYLYNGTGGSIYPQQAADLGYDSSTQAYEGSPYVMNRADAPRDSTLPAVATSGKWEQYGTGPGGSIGPAASAYGAYVVYASLAGVTLSGDCSTGSVNCSSDNTSGAAGNLSQVRQNVVCIAEQELALWNNGTMKPGTDFEKYSDGNDQLWCADFVSWVYNQAGYPFTGGDSGGWRFAGVIQIYEIGNLNQKFHYHPSGGYTPKPGDMAIHYTSAQQYYHVNMVDSVSTGKIVLIGGDQHGGGSAETNVVNNEIISSPNDDNIIGYVGPD